MLIARNTLLSFNPFFPIPNLLAIRSNLFYITTQLLARPTHQIVPPSNHTAIFIFNPLSKKSWK